MPAKHLRAKPAREADDVIIILLDRASDRHRRPGWLLRGRDTPQTGKGAKKALHKAEHATIIADLHQAKHLLDIALHDYNGHRARADHEVHVQGP